MRQNRWYRLCPEATKQPHPNAAAKPQAIKAISLKSPMGMAGFCESM